MALLHTRRVAACLGRACIVAESDGAAQSYFRVEKDRRDDRCGFGSTITSEMGDKRLKGLALVQHQHRTGALAGRWVPFRCVDTSVGTSIILTCIIHQDRDFGVTAVA